MVDAAFQDTFPSGCFVRQVAGICQGVENGELLALHDSAGRIESFRILAPIEQFVDHPLAALVSADHLDISLERPSSPSTEPEPVDLKTLPNLLIRLRKDMKKAAGKLDFEKAAELRDRIRALEQWELDVKGGTRG